MFEFLDDWVDRNNYNYNDSFVTQRRYNGDQKSLDQIFRDKWDPALGHKELKFKKLPRSYCTVFDWGTAQMKRPRRFAAADDEVSWTKAIKTALLSFKDKPVIEHYQYSRKFWLNKHNKKNDK